MVMVMPPYHGATFRVPEAQVRAFFREAADGLDIPLMIQDAPASGVALSAPFLASLAREIDAVSYFKIETAGAASKLRELIALGGDAIEGPWDGEEGITLLADLDAGATGAMTGGGYPDGIRHITDAYFAGRRDEAVAQYARWLPLINYENRQSGFLTAKALMREGGVIACDKPRAPWPELPPRCAPACSTRRGSLDPLVLRWGARREAPCIGSPVQRRRALRTGASRRDSGPSEDRRRHHPDWNTMTLLNPATPAYEAGEAIPRRRWLRVIPPLLLACIISYMDRVNIAFAMPGG